LFSFSSSNLAQPTQLNPFSFFLIARPSTTHVPNPALTRVQPGVRSHELVGLSSRILHGREFFPKSDPNKNELLIRLNDL
jgi:hypothetical protein